MEIACNELSIGQVQQSIDDCQKIVEDFVKICRIVKSSDGRVWLPDDFWRLKIDGENTISTVVDRWKHTSDKVIYAQTLKSVWSQKSWVEIESETRFLVTIKDKKIEAQGCLIAYENKTAVISFLVDSTWAMEEVIGEYGSSEASCSVSVINLATIEQAEKYAEQKRKAVAQTISTSKELCEQLSYLYPHLGFCREAKFMVENVEQAHVKSLMVALDILECYFKTPRSGYNINDVGGGARTESESVKRSFKLKEQRYFKITEVRRKYCFDHLSFGGSYPGRIHYFPDCENAKGYIGYIGKHLPTAKY